VQNIQLTDWHPEFHQPQNKKPLGVKVAYQAPKQSQKYFHGSET
jgi:hypothetical protein